MTMERGAEGGSASLSKDSQLKKFLTVFNPCMPSGIFLPHKAAVSVYLKKKNAACLGCGQFPDICFSFGFSQQYLF